MDEVVDSCRSAGILGIDVATVLECISDSVLVLDREWRITYANSNARKLISESDSLAGKSIWESFPSVGGRSFEASCRRAMNSRAPATCEDFYAPLGAWFENRIFPCAEGIVIYFRDITEQKRREFALQASEAEAREQLQELELIYSTAPIGLAVLSADGRFLRLNHLLAEMNHRSVADHIGKTVREVLPQFAEFFEGVLQRVISTGEPVLGLELDGEMVPNSGDRRVWSERWLPQKDACGKVVAINIVVEDITARKKAEQQNEFLTSELAHRLKNTMTIVQAIAHQAFRRATDPADAKDRLLSRLHALSAAHDALILNEWKGVSLSELVKTQLRPFIGRRAASLVTEGPDVLLPNQTVMKLSMVLHELASNASKHGAFSVNEGIVQLSWRLAGSVLVFLWKERGGPRLSGPPDRKGFGTQVIKRGTKRVEKIFRPDGLVCEFEVPLS